VDSSREEQGSQRERQREDRVQGDERALSLNTPSSLALPSFFPLSSLEIKLEKK
jgi:hypothetical protein